MNEAASADLGAWGQALLGVLSGAVQRGAEIGLAVEPGLVTARVQAPRNGRRHRLELRFGPLAPDAWDQVVSRLEADPALLGALLDGELPEAVVEAAGGGPAVVPHRRAVTVACSCRADRCPFTGAAWWELAELVDRFPATLLTVRGRRPEQLLAAVRRRVARPEPLTDGGVDAAAAFAGLDQAPRPLPRLPALTAAPRRPAWHGTPPAGLPVPDALSLLVADAAARARELRSGKGDGGLELSEEADIARRAARLEGDPSLLLMGHLAAIPVHTLTQVGRTWRRGGAARVDVLHGSWSPPAETLTPARKLLAAYGAVTVVRNQLRLERYNLELRLGRDGLWYLVDLSGGRPSLARPPERDPRLLVVARLGLRAPVPPKPPGPAGEQLRLL